MNALVNENIICSFSRSAVLSTDLRDCWIELIASAGWSRRAWLPLQVNLFEKRIGGQVNKYAVQRRAGSMAQVADALHWKIRSFLLISQFPSQCDASGLYP